jgi:hypothetical protein
MCWPRAGSVPISACINGLTRCKAIGFAPLNEVQNTGKVKEPDAFDSARFPYADGADEAFGCPCVEFCPRTTGEKFVPTFWRSHPDWQIAVALCGKLCGAGILPALPILKPLFHKPPFLLVISTGPAWNRN